MLLVLATNSQTPSAQTLNVLLECRIKVNTCLTFRMCFWKLFDMCAQHVGENIGKFVFTSCWTRSRAFILKLLSISSKQEYLTASRASKPVETSDSLFSTNYNSITRNSSKPFYLNSLYLRMSAIFWCFPPKNTLDSSLPLPIVIPSGKKIHWPIMIISLINFQAVQ